VFQPLLHHQPEENFKKLRGSLKKEGRPGGSVKGRLRNARYFFFPILNFIFIFHLLGKAGVPISPDVMPVHSCFARKLRIFGFVLCWFSMLFQIFICACCPELVLSILSWYSAEMCLVWYISLCPELNAMNMNMGGRSDICYK
jgi:hypothetical protein